MNQSFELEDFLLLLDQNRRLTNFYYQQYPKIILLKEVENKIESLLVTLLTNYKVDSSLKDKFITDYDFDQFQKNSQTLNDPLVGRTYQFEFLANELSLLVPSLLKLFEDLSIDLNSNSTNLKSLWSEKIYHLESVEETYYRTKLTLDSLYSLFKFLKEKNYIKIIVFGT